MTTLPLIVPLADAQDVTLVGGKAINLCRLMQAGLPVPDGFVVTTAAFRKAGVTSTMPKTVAVLIQQAYKILGEPTVAVRSSATAEDLAGASMAGQYDTFLDVTGSDAVVVAVQKCWQSLQAERVQAYLKEQGIDPNDVAVAVVVQQLVPAEVSGVLFTANPRTGALNEMIIEAVNPMSITCTPMRVRYLTFTSHTKPRPYVPGTPNTKPCPRRKPPRPV